MGSMLLALIKFDAVCSSENANQPNQLAELKRCDESLQAVISHCRMLLQSLNHYINLFDTQGGNTATKLNLKPSKVAV